MRSIRRADVFGVHVGSPMFVRGRAMRTFAGLAVFLTLGLLCIGFYLIADEFVNPLASQSFALFVGACVLAGAMILLYELVQVPRKIWRNPVGCLSLHPRVRAGIAVASRATRLGGDLRTDLPYQRCYVDRVRVRA
jgi:hypothetical protein